jgi:hypothetical protein
MEAADRVTAVARCDMVGSSARAGQASPVAKPRDIASGTKRRDPRAGRKGRAGTMIGDMIAQGWENFTERGSGPMSLRFILQPTLASLLAIRAGWKDARSGRPVFLWALVTNSAARKDLVRSGWKDIGKMFVMATVLDATYQVIVHKRIVFVAALITATLLALVPYTVLRGPANRIARAFLRSRAAGQAADRT